MNDTMLPDVALNTDVDSIHEATVISNLIDYLSDLKQKHQYPTHETMNKIFKDKMTDPKAFKKAFWKIRNLLFKI